MEFLSERVVEIPLEGSENVLEIDCSQLPESSYDICEVLEQEKSDIKFYLIFSLEYYKQNKVDEAILLLKRGLSKEASSNISSKLPLINCLANIYIQKAKKYHLSENFIKDAISSRNSSQDQEDLTLMSQLDIDKIKSGREAFFQLATALFKEADRIQPENLTTQLGKGVLYLSSHQYDLALQFFNIVLNSAPSSIGALMGKGRAQYAKKKYTQALLSYQQVLALNPVGDYDPRIGIGLCFYKLGKFKEAALAFEKSIQINDKNLAPYILLSLVKLNDAKAKLSIISGSASHDPEKTELMNEELNQAMQYLKQSYILDANHPAVLISMSQVLYYRRNYQQAAEAARKAFILSDVPTIQAEAQFQLARILHIKKKYEKAYEAYQKALVLNPQHVLARLGLGKTQVYRSEMAAAVSTFQKLLSRFPKCVELMHILGFIHSSLSNQKTQAVEYYESEIKTIASNGNEAWSGDWIEKLNLFSEPDVFLECAYLLESSDISKASKFYLGAKNIINRQVDPDSSLKADKNSYILVEILNNIGVLNLLKNENQAGAQELKLGVEIYEKLLSLGSKPAEGAADIVISDSSGEKNKLAERFSNIDAILYYNLGRAYETLLDYGKARAVYTKLVEKYPGYADAFLRLGVIHLSIENSLDKASECFEQAYKLNPSNIPTLLLQSNLMFTKGDLQGGRRMLEGILKNIDRHDLYTLLSLGNFYLKAVRSETTAINLIKQTMGLEGQNLTAYGDKSQRSSSKSSLAIMTAEYKRHIQSLSISYKRAHEFFRKCFTLNPKCLFAVNGFGASMAERGYYTNAKDLFIAVRDAQVSYSLESSLIGASSSSSSLDNRSTNASSNNLFGSGISNLDSLLNSTTGFELPAVLGGAFSHDPSLITCSNLAHTYVEMGEYRTAVNLYEACIKKARLYVNSSADRENNLLNLAELRNLQLCLSRALYTQARVNKSIPIMQQALTHLSVLCSDFERCEASSGAIDQSQGQGQGQGQGQAATPADGLESDKTENDNKDNDSSSVARKEQENLGKQSESAGIASIDGFLKKESTDDSQAEVKEDLSSSHTTTAATSTPDDKAEHISVPKLTISKHDSNLVLVDGSDPVLLYNLALAKQNLAQLVSELPAEQCSTEEFDSVLTGLNESNNVFANLSRVKEPLAKLLSELTPHRKKPSSSSQRSSQSADITKLAASSGNKSSAPKFHIDPKLAFQRASFGKYIFTSLQKKIEKHVEMEKQKKEQAEASRKRRHEQLALQEAERAATLEAQQKQEDLLLEQTKLRNDLLRAEMTKPSYGAPGQFNDGYSSNEDRDKDRDTERERDRERDREKPARQRKGATKARSYKKMQRDSNFDEEAEYETDRLGYNNEYSDSNNERSINRRKNGDRSRDSGRGRDKGGAGDRDRDSGEIFDQGVDYDDPENYRKPRRYTPKVKKENREIYSASGSEDHEYGEVGNGTPARGRGGFGSRSESRGTPRRRSREYQKPKKERSAAGKESNQGSSDTPAKKSRRTLKRRSVAVDDNGSGDEEAMGGYIKSDKTPKRTKTTEDRSKLNPKASVTTRPKSTPNPTPKPKSKSKVSLGQKQKSEGKSSRLDFDEEVGKKGSSFFGDSGDNDDDLFGSGSDLSSLSDIGSGFDSDALLSSP